MAGVDRPVQMAPGLLVLIGLASAALVLGFLRSASAWAAPAILALMLTIAVHPIRAWLARLGAPEWLRFLLPLLTVLTFLGAMGLAVTVSVNRLISLLPEYSTQFANIVEEVTRRLARIGVDTGNIAQQASELNPANLVPVLQTFLNGVVSVSSTGILLVTLLVAMCLDATALGRQLAALESEKPDLVRALRSIVRDTYSYLKVSTIFGFLMAVLDVIALRILDVPLPLLWGLLAFVANYIPTVGFVLALIPPALLALLIAGPAKALAVVITYLVINFVTQSLLLPRFLGNAVGLSTTLTMLSLIVWASVLGPLGAILAVPLTLMVRALLLDIDPGKSWAGRLLTGASPPHPEGPPASAK